MSLALSARPDFAQRVSALIDEQRDRSAMQGYADRKGRTVSDLTFDEAEARRKGNATQFFATTYPVDYAQGEALYKQAMHGKAGDRFEARKAWERWKKDGAALVAAGVRVAKASGITPARGLVRRLFRKRALTATQWHAITTATPTKQDDTK